MKSPVETSTLKAPPLGDSLTPAMRQYADQKKRVGDAILLFRMGDFYETFWDDAVLCSKVLGIALTCRNKDSADPIPLAGIPYHALESYLGKLVAAGYKVAISEQLEDPKLAKGVVKRDVVRVVTAGTLTDEKLLNERDDNTLAALCIEGQGSTAGRAGKSGPVAGIAFVELAGGRFEVVDVPLGAALDELVRARPAELLIDDERSPEVEGLAARVRDLCGTAIARRGSHEFSIHQTEKCLHQHFQVATLAGFGLDAMTAAIRAAGCVVQYLQETQRTALSHITSIRPRSAGDHLQIDQSSWRSLEIDRTLRSGNLDGTLLWAVDCTVHPHGGRKLRHWLRAPLTSVEAIRQRQAAVRFFVEDDAIRGRVRQQLHALADIERITARAALGRCSPRDLNSLGRALQSLPVLAGELGGCRANALEQAADDFGRLHELCGFLAAAIRDDPSNALREGGFIADGFDAELDRLRAIGRDGQQWLADYQRAEMARTGIGNLKAGFNRVFGYYLEVPNSSREKVPPHFIRKQTVKNAERYITEELKKHEDEVLTAQERADELEYALFEKVRLRVTEFTERLMRAAEGLAQLDCFAGLAELAVNRRYACPGIVEDGRLEIVDGRHPVLDRVLGDAFVPNDTIMDAREATVFVITGPNMAGKSTYIRQAALLTILAQIGSYVPARKMVLSPVDRIFARVGSSDEIMRGQSTFMVEMTEAANILHNATPNSLVILDELGRGTSTFDGLSLAWAITEHLANKINCRTLVATHYHELIELGGLLRNVKNFNVAVKEYPPAGQREEGIVFLHTIVPGGASRSYGIQVARLAGVPPAVIQRSREVLDELQRGFERESRAPQLARQKTRDAAQLQLFREPGEELLTELCALPETLDAPAAADVLRRWKERFT